jgi:hypothetical protein
MPIENIVIGVLGTIVGGLFTFFLTRKKYEADVDKSKAEADKFRAETQKIRRELELSTIHTSTKPHEARTSNDREITVLPAERSLLAEDYLKHILSSAKIDMLALTLQSALEHFGQGRFIQWIKDGKNIRMMMLSPYSAAAKLRSLEEDTNENFLYNKITVQIKELKSLYTQAEEQLKNLNVTGSLEVRLYDDLPYFSYFHTEKVMVMGLYYVHIRGLQSEALLIDEKSSIHANMCKHFDTIWAKSGTRSDPRMTVCTISKLHMEFNDPLLDAL